MKIYCILPIFLVVISCKKENVHEQINTCPNSSYGSYRIFSAPDSVKVDSAINVSILWENFKNCQTFDGFEPIITGNNRQIKIKTIIDTCNCDNSQVGIIYLPYYTFYSHSPGIEIIDYGINSDTIVIY